MQEKGRVSLFLVASQLRDSHRRHCLTIGACQDIAAVATAKIKLAIVQLFGIQWWAPLSEEQNQSWFNAILLSETARNFFQFGSRWSGWLILTRSMPAAALRSRSDDLMLSGRYLSTTKSTRPPLINPCVAYRNTWSARCENVSPVGRVVWSTASINAAMGGTSSTGCVPDSSKRKRQDLISLYKSSVRGGKRPRYWPKLIVQHTPHVKWPALRHNSQTCKQGAVCSHSRNFLFENFEIEGWSSCWSKLDNVQFDTGKRQIARWEQLPACQD